MNLNINEQIISFGDKNLKTSQRAGYFLKKLFFKLDSEIFSELENKIITNYEKGFVITKNTIKNSLIFILINKNQDKINEADKYEDNFHTLAKIYGFGEEYFNGLSNFISDKKIKFDTKRNLFLSLFLGKI
ncbi:hypothetical protein DLH72_02110 [Candidatus Gracilibacteria bacterium]|nr:MAG: hypothetical protein DLH72_02110 [Candidatus Gracilibacteria bacterium]